MITHDGSVPGNFAFDWAAAPRAAGGKPDPQQIRAAAAEFEALLVGQMLRSMREAGGGGWLGGDTGDAAFSLMELAEQCLASALAAQGGLGLARLAEEALSRQSQQIQAPGPGGGRPADRDPGGS